MSGRSLAQKMHIKPGYRMLLMNAPDTYQEQLQPLPDGVEIADGANEPVDVVHLFVKDKADVDQHVPVAINAVKRGGLLWIAYPKKTSGITTDIHRDTGWDAVESAGWRGIAQVAIDDTWTATRFRPAADVKRRQR